MIARLRNYKAGGHYTSFYTYKTGERIFSDEQIAEAFGITKERVGYLAEYHRTKVAPRNFSNEEMKENYWKFWDKHNRWHTRADERNWRETGLHSGPHWRARTDWMEHYCAMRESKLRKHPEMVFTIPNLTTRRNVIERLGGADALVRLLVNQGKAKELQRDDFGILWRLDFPDGRDSHMRYVEVINTTPNEKGEYDHYFLRVPPTTTSARAGVAWTFDKPTRGFKFAAQS